jgi:polyisoprenoid-binding protein YceI
VAGLFCLLVAPAPALAQAARWTIDQKSSLAWWQIDPHMNHLWATTCPEEPSWRPGEGRSGGWFIDRAFRPPKNEYAAVSDTTIIPLYPRPRIRAVCAEAVSGQIVITNPAKWGGVTGNVTVKPDALVGGENRRDDYARKSVFETNRYPEILFQIDSVIDVTTKGDTLIGRAVGTWTLRGLEKPVNAGVKAWPVAGGLRVLGKFRIPAGDLEHTYNVSQYVLGLGIGVGVWKYLYMGVDLMMRPGSGGATGTAGGAN